MALDVKYGGSSILTLGEVTKNYKLLTKDTLLNDDVLLMLSSLPIGETTAVAADVTVGKYFFTAAGVKTLGTAPVVYTKIAEQDFSVNTTSTSATSVGSITAGSAAYTDAKIVYVKIRDKAGPRTGYFTGSDNFFINNWPRANPGQTIQNAGRLIIRKDSSGNPQVYAAGTTTGYGVYASSISDGGIVNIYRRYNSANSLVINGTYNVQVYGVEYAPTQGDPFDYSF